MPQINQKCHKWSAENDEFIKNNYATMTVKELAEYFGVKNKAMRARIERLNIKLRPLNRHLAVEWTSDDLNFLHENWLYMQDKDIAEILGTDRGFNKEVVFRKRHALGLKNKSKRIREEKTGYKYYIVYDKRIYTHREKIENKIGRTLKYHEIVHHIDGDKSNDNIENLYLCKDISEHTCLHDDLEKIAMKLVKNGDVKFDHEKGKYYLTQC